MRKIQVSPFSEAELRELAGPMPTLDPEFNETWDIRWNVWQMIRRSQSLSRTWIKLQLKTTILGYHHASYKVIGITREGLNRLAGPTGEFSTKWQRNTMQRAHLYPVRLCQSELMSMSPDLTPMQLAEWVWCRDVVVLSLKEENHLLEDRDFFERNTITFSNPYGTLFRDLGSICAYGSDERRFLKTLYDASREDASHG
jgi:hypothetical protein